MGRFCRGGIFFAFLFAFALPARAADPILMFLLGFAKNVMERQIANSLRAPAPAEPLPDLGKTYPGTAVEPQIVRRLIDDSFIYLSEDQRAEIFESFNRALLNPVNAPIRGQMIEHFARTALAVRAAQVRLSQLSYREKQMLAAEFKEEIAGIGDAEIELLRGVLEKGLLPVPMDLNQLFLATLESRPAAAPRAPPPAMASQPLPGS